MKIFNQKQLAIILLGLIAVPFIMLVVMLLTGSKPAFMPVQPALAIHSLGVVCVSFFSGIQWGVHFCKRTGDSVYVIAFCILAFAALSLLDPGGIKGISLLLATFVVSCIVELRLSQQRVTTLWYWQTRCACSLLIVLSLGVALTMLAKQAA